MGLFQGDVDSRASAGLLQSLHRISEPVEGVMVGELDCRPCSVGEHDDTIVRAKFHHAKEVGHDFNDSFLQVELVFVDAVRTIDHVRYVD